MASKKCETSGSKQNKGFHQSKQNMNKKFRTRKLEDGDIQVIAELDQTMCKALSKGSEHPVVPYGFDWLNARLKSNRTSFGNWYAMAGFDVATSHSVGFVVCSHQKMRKRKKSSKSRTYLEVFWICVKPHFRGQGLGKFLLAECMKEAAERDTLLVEARLHVNCSNTGALRLYEKVCEYLVQASLSLKLSIHQVLAIVDHDCLWTLG